jgi:hypothetical protein
MDILVSLPDLFLPVFLFQTYQYLLQFLYVGTRFVPLLLNIVENNFKPQGVTVIYNNSIASFLIIQKNNLSR